MKNMKISVKLITSFLIVALMAAIVGISGIVGLRQMDAAASDMYENQTEPLRYISSLTTELQRMRVGMREYALGVAENDAAKIQSTKQTIDSMDAEMRSNFDAYRATMKDAEAIELFEKAYTIYKGSYTNYLNDIYQCAAKGDFDGCVNVLNEAKADVDVMIGNLDTCLEFKLNNASNLNDRTTSLSASLLILIIAVLIAALAVASFFAFYISGLISKPLLFLKDVLYEMGAKGRVDFSEEEYRQAGILAEAKDETGQSIQMLINTGRRLEAVGKSMERIANGDLTEEIKLLSDADTLGNYMQKMLNNLNNMFGEINNATSQVATGSKQIADGSQALAQGSTQQAAAVEQLSSSISEIAEKTKENSIMADKAASLANTIMGNAEKGSRQMDEMMAAVKEINDASQNINKVIKVIDDIAFQTNILALNAAVEAARAGQHGKGFAVVAEEVRSLAAKSAEAAKDTGSLIANSMEKAELGARIAGDTAASLVEIVSGINESTQLVSDIAKSSEEQSGGIAQINKGIDQVAQVVQQNSATAEESAAASEEMSSQSDMLQGLVAQFKLKNSGSSFSRLSAQSTPAQPKRLAMPEKKTYTPPESDGDFGKY